MINNTLNDNFGFELSKISKIKTGLPVIVWVQTIISGQNCTPRIYFANTHEEKTQPNMLIPLSISHNPIILSKNPKLNIPTSQFNEIKQWIIRNETLLLKLWKDEICTDDFIEQMK